MFLGRAPRTGPQLLPQYRDVTVELVEKHKQHWYKVTGFDELLPSVTNILKVIDKSGPLVGWAKNVTLEKVRQELADLSIGDSRDEAVKQWYEVPEEWIDNVLARAKKRPDSDDAAKGRDAHGLIAELLHGGKPDIPEELAPAVHGALEMVSDYGLTVEAVEYPVWDPRYEYAGTVDLIARDTDGRLVVVDWKRAKGIYDEHAYQVSAYARAIAGCG